MATDIGAFLLESNRIEGIVGVQPAEIEATEKLLVNAMLTVTDIEEYVAVIQPGAKLRCVSGMNVRVGGYLPPPGGKAILAKLGSLLYQVNEGHSSPYRNHVGYELLHPFMDGNGRSGRAIWLWQMTRQHHGTKLGFLHQWYYQSLQAAERAP